MSISKITNVPKTRTVVRAISMVRAGDHYLSRLLDHALAPSLEIAPGELSPPSSGSAGLPYVLWRSNDAMLAEPLRVTGTKLLVQTREPVGQLVAMAQRRKRLDGDRFNSNDLAFLEFWVAQSALHWRAFKAKWVDQPIYRSVILDYHDLIADPARSLERALELFKVKLSTTTLAATIAKNVMHANEEVKDLIPEELLLSYRDVCHGIGSSSRLQTIVSVLADAQIVPHEDRDRIVAAAQELGNPRLVKAARGLAKATVNS